MDQGTVQRLQRLHLWLQLFRGKATLYGNPIPLRSCDRYPWIERVELQQENKTSTTGEKELLLPFISHFLLASENGGQFKTADFFGAQSHTQIKNNLRIVFLLGWEFFRLFRGTFSGRNLVFFFLFTVSQK
jgi:hypothetical protein